MHRCETMTKTKSQRIAGLGELEAGDNVFLQGNGMEQSGEVESIEESELDYNTGEMAFVRTDDTVLTVSEPEPHPLQTSDDLFSVGGFGKVKLFKE